MKVLALDIAGASTGWASGDLKGLHDYGKYISNLSNGKAQRLCAFYDWLVQLLEAENPEIILIEKPYLGRNSKVLVNLSKFVAMAEIAVFDTLGIEIEDEWFLDPRGIKKAIHARKPKSRQSPKKKHDENKEIMVKKINSLYGLKLKYKSGRNKKYCDDDIADAIAIYHVWRTKNFNSDS